MSDKISSAFTRVRVFLGLFLLAAAGLKAYALSTSPVAEHGILGSRLLTIASVELEIVLGVWLLSGLFQLSARAVAICLFGVFSAITLYRAMSGAESCGCFGNLRVNPWLTLIVDAVALLALIMTKPPVQAESKPSGTILVRRTAISIMAALFLGITSGILMLRYQPATLDETGRIVGTDTNVVLSPESWIGKRFPLLPFISGDIDLNKGTWLVVLYQHNCSHCLKSLPKYEAMALRSGEGSGEGVILVELSPYASPDDDPVPKDTICKRGRLSDGRNWFVGTPAEVTVEDGIVTSASENGDR